MNFLKIEKRNNTIIEHLKLESLFRKMIKVLNRQRPGFQIIYLLKFKVLKRKMI